MDHNILGRIGNIAIIDLLGTFGMSYVLSNINNDRVVNNFIYLFILGEFVHIVRKQETPIIKSLSTVSKF